MPRPAKLGITLPDSIKMDVYDSSCQIESYTADIVNYVTHASNHYRPGQSRVCKQLCDYGKRFEHNGYTLQARRHKLFFRATVTSVIMVTSVIEVVALLIGSSLTAYVLTGAVSWVLNMVFLLTGVIMFIYRLGYVHTHTNCHMPISHGIGRQDKDAVNG